MSKEQKRILWKCGSCGDRGSCELTVDPAFEEPLQCPFNYADYNFKEKKIANLTNLKQDEEIKVGNIMDDL